MNPNLRIKINFNSEKWLNRKNEIEKYFKTSDFDKENQNFEDGSLFFTLNLADEVTLTDPQGLSLKINFDHDHLHYQKKIQKKELLFRALGIDHEVTHVVDLTCGLARDSVMMAQVGFSVLALERHPWIWFLLSEAQESSHREIIKKIKFIHQDAMVFLRQALSDSVGRTGGLYGSSVEVNAWQINPETKIALYYDPMFPEKKKTALPGKEMQIFKQIVGADQDSDEVLKLALESKPLWSRIVVKRALRDAPLVRKPKQSYEGKLIRYDVY